jgi:hypothetical protein
MMSGKTWNPDVELAGLRWREGMLVKNHFGDWVWLKPCVVDGQRIGITDCCFAMHPCRQHDFEGPVIAVSNASYRNGVFGPYTFDELDNGLDERDAELTATPPSAKEPDCNHHWVVEAGYGPRGHGAVWCNKCGATRPPEEK